MKKYLLFLKLLLAVTFLSCDSDSGLEPLKSGFGGTVYFDNDWPDNTDQVLVVAATKFPPTDITDIIMGDPLPLYVDSVDYVVYTPPAEFAAVGLVWKEKNQPWDVTNIVGIYFPTDNHFAPGQVTISDYDTMIDTIDIYADLSVARRKVESTIEGTLRVKGEWPATAQSVLVAVSKNSFPTSLLDVNFGFPITAGFDSTTYTLNVQPGTYKLVGCLVIDPNIPLGIESIRGVYKKPGDIFVSSVDVPTDTSHIKNIDITITFE